MVLELPKGIQIIELPHAMRFKGDAASIERLESELRIIQHSSFEQKYTLGSITLIVSDELPYALRKGTYQMPRDAWNVLASKFMEVAMSLEDSPFDFNDCGYLYPPLEFDLGVELVVKPNPH
ncbi:hypothetical protein [Hymenobacter sp. HDW8]|uniref:hypothetical protein n=1 Tax=Hymenobacter sp. HDW8 TaxID=2714932 RepID=UPI001408ECD0|nr:hypothetical protein [Hymenobacter sp. HDW8]QIL74611.1 hypothetical protein G7064_01080 [Hymenobacter sp. HDW8]